MPVASVQMPNYQQSDGLGQLAKVLGIISSAYGIKTDYERSKLLDEQMKHAARQNEISDLNKQGIYTPDQERDFIHFNEPVPGSRELIFQRVKRNDDLSPVTDETGKPVIEQYKSNAISKETAEALGLMTKNEIANIQYNEALIRSQNGIPPADLLNYDIEKEQKPGFQEKWTPINGEHVKIWARKKGYKPPLMGGKPVSQRDIKGYENAIAAGIENPTAQDIFDWDPKNLNNDVLKLKTDMTGNSIPETVDILSQIDHMIGNGGIDGQGPIPGIGPEYSYGNLPLVGGLLTSYKMDPKAREIRQTVGRLRDALIKKQAGGNVTDNEWKRAAESLAAGAFTKPEDLRNALKTTRSLIYREISSKEAGYSGAARETYQSRNGSIHSQLPIFRMLNQERKGRQSIIPQNPDQITPADAIDLEVQGD